MKKLDPRELAAGKTTMGDWCLSWDAGHGKERGVAMLLKKSGNRLEVLGYHELDRASQLEQLPAWVKLLEERLEEMRQSALRDAAENWTPKTEKLAFRHARTGLLYGHVLQLSLDQRCPWCEAELCSRPPVGEAPIRFFCECGFEWNAGCVG